MLGNVGKFYPFDINTYMFYALCLGAKQKHGSTSAPIGVSDGGIGIHTDVFISPISS